MLANSRLLVFTRYPEAGRCKTRLLPALGAEGAARLQKRLTAHLIAQEHQVEQFMKIPTSVYYTGGSEEKMTSWLGSMTYIEQVEGDIGEKMMAAFSHAFSDGSHAAILVGSDIPDITSKILIQGFEALHHDRVVIGPALDGGYYLIGMCAAQAATLVPLLFSNIRWSRKDLFTSTMGRLARAGFDVITLPRLQDIDQPEDLPLARMRGLL